MPALVSLPFSPWSEKAKWALEARGVPFEIVRYQPLIGELGLRRLLRRWRGRVTVPVLVTDAGVIDDSAAIARWADERGSGPTLFPRAHSEVIGDFIAESERGLAAGRVVSLHRVLADDDALLEMVPRAITRKVGRRAAARIGSFGIRRTLRKYSAGEPAAATDTLIEVLDRLRAKVRAAAGGPLLADFSFADIAMTQVLAFVEPPSFGLKLGAANRRAFLDPALRERYGDLVEWRDAIYAAHRPS